MREKNRIRCLTALFLICLTLIITAVVYGGIHFNTDDRQIKWGNTEILSDGWYYITDAGRQEISSLPAEIDLTNDSVSDESLTLYRRLPEVLPEQASISINSGHMIIEAFADGRLIYQYGVNSKAPVGYILGNSWNLIELPSDAAGKELSIRLTAPYFPERYSVPEVWLGSKSAVQRQFLFENISTVIICFLMVVIGVLTLLASVFIKIKESQIDISAFVFLSVFMIISAVWTITDSRVISFATGNYAAAYLLSHFSFMLLPVPLLLFLRQTAAYGKSVYGIMSILHMLDFLILGSLYFLGIADLVLTLPITHVLIGASILVCLVLNIREYCHYHNKNAFFILAGMISVAAGASISLVLFIFNILNDNSIFFSIGLILFFAFLFYSAVSRAVKLIKAGLKAHIYREQAYSDALTDLDNRASFDQQVNILQNNPDCRTLTVILFDINGLKRANDSYGHMVGDELIRCAARCIRRAFEPIGNCYRIGGDEFVVLLKDFPDELLESIFERFENYVASARPGIAGTLDIAFGYDSGPAEGPDFVSRLFRTADRRMYDNKRSKESNSGTAANK